MVSPAARQRNRQYGRMATGPLWTRSGKSGVGRPRIRLTSVADGYRPSNLLTFRCINLSPVQSAVNQSVHQSRFLSTYLPTARPIRKSTNLLLYLDISQSIYLTIFTVQNLESAAARRRNPRGARWRLAYSRYSATIQRGHQLGWISPMLR